MKKNKIVLLCGIFLVVVLMALPFMTACAAPTPAPAPAPAPAPSPAPAPAPAPAPTEPIVLKVVSFLNVRHPHNTGIKQLAEAVNKRSNGQLVIDFVGGPEVISMFDLPSAVKNGSIEMAQTSPGFYLDWVPEGLAAYAAQTTVAEERERGFADLMRQLHAERMNVYWLGTIVRNSPAIFTINKMVETPYDLAGVRFSTTPGFSDYCVAVGGKPVIIPIPEVYTAMERGLVEADVTTPVTVVVMKLYEVVDYWIDHDFSAGGREMLLVNLDVWNKIPKNLQDILIEEMDKVEMAASDLYAGIIAGMKATMVENGMTPITFSPADAKWFVDTVDGSTWENVKENVSPEMYDRLRDMLVK